jgi:hypothetical protein
MAAMVNQLDPQTVLARFQDIADASKDVMSTDIPSGELPKFLELGSKVKGQRVTSVQFVPPLITPAHPDYQMIHTTVTRTLEAAARPAPSPTVSAVTPAPSSSSTAARPPAAGGSTVVTTTAAPTGGAVDLRAVCSAA